MTKIRNISVYSEVTERLWKMTETVQLVVVASGYALLR